MEVKDSFVGSVLSFRVPMRCEASTRVVRLAQQVSLPAVPTYAFSKNI